MKFQLLQLYALPKDIKLLLLGFIRDVEHTLEVGILLHFGGVAMDDTFKMTFDDFCEFTVLSLDRALKQ